MAPTPSASASLGYRPDAFLMAVAIGAGCDFLTPIGHQCNTLVMGPGGYRFGDYARLGAPLSLLVIAVAVPAHLAAGALGEIGRNQPESVGQRRHPPQRSAASARLRSPRRGDITAELLLRGDGRLPRHDARTLLGLS
jgi:hypothetical protein